MDDSTIRDVIKLIETRIAVLSKEDPTNNERVIREFENLRQSILLKVKEKEDVDENLRQSILKEKDVDMDNQNDDEEEEDPLKEFEKKLEKQIVVGVILELLSYFEEHESALFTADLFYNPPDVDPMLLLSDDDLVVIRNSVEKLSDSSLYLWNPLSAFCEKAEEWLEQHPHSNGDDSKITLLRDHFLGIISAGNNKIKEFHDNRACARKEEEEEEEEEEV